MPEAPELRLTAEFINKHCNSEIVLIEKSEVSKNSEPLQVSNHAIHAQPNGKILNLTLFGDNSTIYIQMTMGMSGHFKITEWNEHIPKHAHLIFRMKDGRILSYVDPRRFGKWKFSTSEIHDNRGPSIFDQVSFEHHFMDRLSEEKVQNAYLLDIIMSQRLFNGVGNYLRAEILYQVDLNPFCQIKSLSSLEIIKLLKACTSVAEQSYQLGGGQLKDWKNPNGHDSKDFKSWLKIYGKGESINDKSGRKFWFDEKWIWTWEYQAYWDYRNLKRYFHGTTGTIEV